MREIYITAVLLVVFVCAMIIGLSIVNHGQKKKYSFLKNFPFEMKSDNLSLTVIFRFTLALFCGVSSVESLLLFFLEGMYLIEKALALVLILNSFLLVSLFIIDTRNYYVHAVTSILFMSLNAASYLLLFYLPIRDAFSFYPVWLSVVAAVIAVVLLGSEIGIFFNNCFRLKKDGQGNYTRGKVFPLAFGEWVKVFGYVLLFLIVILDYILKLSA